MLHLNLLPDVKKEFLHAQRQRNTVITICLLVSAGFVAALIILGVIIGGQTWQKSNVSKEIKSNSQDILGTRELSEYLTIQNQLSQLESLNDSQIIYSRLFDYLRQLNPAAPNNVELYTIKVTSDGDGSTIVMEGMIRNFAALDVFKTTLQNATITYTTDKNPTPEKELLFQDSSGLSTVVVREAGISQSDEQNRVGFSISVIFNKAAFSPNSIGIIIEVPDKITSDADRAAPQEVFGNNIPSDLINNGAARNEGNN